MRGKSHFVLVKPATSEMMKNTVKTAIENRTTYINHVAVFGFFYKQKFILLNTLNLHLSMPLNNPTNMINAKVFENIYIF